MTIRARTLIAAAAAALIPASIGVQSIIVALLSAVAMTWIVTRGLTRRTRAITAAANRYRDADQQTRHAAYGDDEIANVAYAFEAAIQELQRRLAERERDWARMQAILSGMIEGVIVVDGDGRLRLANDAARRVLRVDDVMIGRSYPETIRHPAVTQLITGALEGKTLDAVWFAPPTDPARTIMARAAPTTSAVGPGAVLVLHDITDLRRADQMRRDFVANVSHELRTPLTAIRGYLEALSDPEIGPDEHTRFLDVIARHAVRMQRLVDDLLRLARLDAGQETLDISCCDARALIQSVVGDVARQLEQRAQCIDVSIQPGAESCVPIRTSCTTRCGIWWPTRSRMRLNAP